METVNILNFVRKAHLRCDKCDTKPPPKTQVLRRSTMPTVI